MVHNSTAKTDFISVIVDIFDERLPMKKSRLMALVATTFLNPEEMDLVHLEFCISSSVSQLNPETN